MACSLHPSRKPLGGCQRCQRITCELCTKIVDGTHFCTTCGISLRQSQAFQRADRAAPPRYQPPPARTGMGRLLVIGAAALIVFGAWRKVEENRGLTENVAARADDMAKVASTGITDAVVRKEMQTLFPLIEYHYVTHGGFPADMRAFVTESLRLPPGRKKGEDPFGNVYRLEELGAEKFRIISPGRDHQPGTDDDIVVEGY